MKFTSKVIIGAILACGPTVALAQAIPQLQNPGIVAPGLANAVPYYAVVGSRVVGGTVMTFDPATGTFKVPLATADQLHSSTTSLILGIDGGFGPETIATLTGSGYVSSFPISVRNESTFRGFHAPSSNSNVIALGYVGTSALIHITVPDGFASDYNINLPYTAGLTGQPWISKGGGSAVMDWGALSGAGGTFVTSIGVPANGCPVWLSGNLGSTGSACSTSSGSVNPGLINQMAWYAATGSTASGLPTLASGVLNTDGYGVPSITASPTISGTFTGDGLTAVTSINGSYLSGTTNLASLDGSGKIVDSTIPLGSVVYGGTDGGSENLRVITTDSIAYARSVNTIVAFVSGFTNTGVMTAIINANDETRIYVATPTGPVQVQAGQMVAGNLVLLAFDGTNYQYLNPLPGSGVVSPGVINQLGVYNATGNTISGLATANSGILNTSVTGVPSVSTDPTISGTMTAGGITTPLVAGGTTASSTLSLKSTTGSGSSDFISFFAGSAERARIDTVGAFILGQGENTATPGLGLMRPPTPAGTNIAGADLFVNAGRSTGSGAGGRIVFGASVAGASGSTPSNVFTKMTVAGAGVGIGGVPPTAQLQLAAGTAAVNKAPLKFVSGPVLTTPEAGAMEFSGTDIYMTTSTTRKLILIGSVDSLSSGTLTTTDTVVGSINMSGGETYIVDTELHFTSSANTVIISFDGTLVGASTLDVVCNTASGATSTTTGLVANGGGSVTCPATTLGAKITGSFLSGSAGLFSVKARTTAGTVAILDGSYYKYIHN